MEQQDQPGIIVLFILNLLVLRISLCEISSSSFCGLYFSTLKGANDKTQMNVTITLVETNASVIFRTYYTPAP